MFFRGYWPQQKSPIKENNVLFSHCYGVPSECRTITFPVSAKVSQLWMFRACCLSETDFCTLSSDALNQDGLCVARHETAPYCVSCFNRSLDISCCVLWVRKSCWSELTIFSTVMVLTSCTASDRFSLVDVADKPVSSTSSSLSSLG